MSETVGSPLGIQCERRAIRPAVDEHEREGLVSAQHGGTFVHPAVGQAFDQHFRGSLTDLISEIKRANIQVGSTLLASIAKTGWTSDDVRPSP